MDNQLSFANNGNIRPCPWTAICINHPSGCSGQSYWCKRCDTETDRKEMEKAKRFIEQQGARS